MASSGAANMPFIKNLASSDGKVRNQSLDSLKAFLSTKYAFASGPALTFDDAQKLWAGLFYALWMADRVPVQQRLCNDLAALPVSTGLSDASTAAWLRGFWATMARQWTTGIDVLRMDKFMLLVRRVLAAQLTWMDGEGAKKKKGGKKGKKEKKEKKGQESKEAERLGLKVLEDWPLNPEAEAPLGDGDDYEGSDNNDDDDDEDQDYGGRLKKRRRSEATTMHVPVGLSIHVSDIWVDELDKLGLVQGGARDDDDDDDNANDDNSSPEDDLVRKINRLVEALAARTGAPAVRQRARDSLADERLPWNQQQHEADGRAGTGGLEGGGLAGDDDDDVDDDASWDGFND